VYCLVAGDVADAAAEGAAPGLAPAHAGGADEDDGEAGISGHGNRTASAKREWPSRPTCLASTAGSVWSSRACDWLPRPMRGRPPSLPVARLAVVDQADDAFVESGAVIGLIAGRDQLGEAPALGQHLLLPVGMRGRSGGRGAGTRRKDGAKLHNDRHRTAGVSRSGEGEIDVDRDRG